MDGLDTWHTWNRNGINILSRSVFKMKGAIEVVRIQCVEGRTV